MSDATFVYKNCGTALLLAIHQGDAAVVELLLQYEADVKRRISLGDQAIIERLSPISVVRYREQRILDDRNSHGEGVLQVAVSMGDPALVLLLLQRGAHSDCFSISHWRVLIPFYCGLMLRCRLVHLTRISLVLLIRCLKVPFRNAKQSAGNKMKRD